MQIIEQWRSSKEDKSSVDVEIGLLSEKISILEERLQNSPRIERTQLRLQLVAYVHSRRKKLNYLLSTDTSRYHKALDRLKMSAWLKISGTYILDVKINEKYGNRIF